jgi:hypothetical protein
VKQPRLRSQLWLLLSLLAAIVAWFYMQRVLLPWEHYFNVEAGPVKAALGDLYSPWKGTRALLREGRNPYGPQVTHEIQMAFYGHDIRQSYAPGLKVIDEQRFAYPVYVVFLLAPIQSLDFETARAWSPVVLALVVVSSTLLWMSFLRWRPSWVIAAAITLFILVSPQIAQGLRLRQLGLLVATLLAVAAWLVRENHLISAGAVLGVATIKPQMAILTIAWLMIWSLGDLSKRWRLPAAFLSMLAALILAGEIALPGWLHDFVVNLAAYRQYGRLTTPLQLVLGRMAGAIVAIIAIAGLLAWAWTNRKHSADTREFAGGLAAFLMGTVIFLPLIPPFNQALLILPVLLLIRDWNAFPTAARIAFAATVSWPWIASLVLLVLAPPTKSLAAVPLLPSALVLLLPFLLPLVLISRGTTATESVDV